MSPTAPRLPFWKVESTGNDFVLIHLEDAERVASGQRLDDFLADLASKGSDRRFGIGADGLLVVSMRDGVLVDRMFNPDGTEDYCGNGIRCVVDHAARQHWITSNRVTVLHLGHCIDATLDEHGEIRYVAQPASYEPADIPLRRDTELFDTTLFEIDGRAYRGSVLSTGTAHTIVQVDELPGDEEFFRVSPKIEDHPIFPERTSVMWTQETAPDSLSIRIWERGAGETFGCGSGSTAAAIDYLRRKDKAGRIVVRNPGGMICIESRSWRDAPTACGYAKEIYTGELFLS